MGGPGDHAVSERTGWLLQRGGTLWRQSGSRGAPVRHINPSKLPPRADQLPVKRGDPPAASLALGLL
jgi:hypothetical protein